MSLAASCNVVLAQMSDGLSLRAPSAIDVKIDGTEGEGVLHLSHFAVLGMPLWKWRS